ncbi:chromosome partitioning protein, partial [Bartonella sp. ML71XJBT]|uniref:chromosome partitioning protein n=1 Tax=Bartonella sp. ML71XJBT TaxID=3019094 RepID=UPI00235F30F5
ADKDNAALLEVAENLFRNELSVIDRALFVQTYRELWEKKYGEIKVGGDRKSKGKVYPLIGGNQYTKDKVAKVQVAPLPKDGSSEHHETGCEGEKVAKGQVDPLPNDGSVEHHETGGEGEKVAKGKHYPLPNDGDLNGKMQSLHFATHVADRIGLSKESVKLLNRIAQHLQPELRSVLRGTALADNQAQLLKLAKMEPVAQRRVAIALQQVEGDLRRAVDLVNGINIPPKVNEQERTFAQLLSVWQRADAQTRARFYDYLNKQSGEGQA